VLAGPSRSSSFRATPQRPFPPTPTKTTPSPGPGPSIPASPPADHLAATSPGASPQAGSGSAAAAAAAAAPAAAEAVTTPPRPALAPGLKKGFFGSRPAAPAAKASPGVASPSASQGTGSVSPSRSGQQEGEGSPAARQVSGRLDWHKHTASMAGDEGCWAQCKTNQQGGPGVVLACHTQPPAVTAMSGMHACYTCRCAGPWR
jgi:hypothetical protein